MNYKTSLGFALITLGFAGCASPPKLGKDGKPIEYVYYTPTGSNIAIRVPKDQAPTQTSDRETQQAQEALSEIQQRGMTPMKDPAGGK